MKFFFAVSLILSVGISAFSAENICGLDEKVYQVVGACRVKGSQKPVIATFMKATDTTNYPEGVYDQLRLHFFNEDCTPMRVNSGSGGGSEFYISVTKESLKTNDSRKLTVKEGGGLSLFGCGSQSMVIDKKSGKGQAKACITAGWHNSLLTKINQKLEDCEMDFDFIGKVAR